MTDNNLELLNTQFKQLQQQNQLQQLKQLSYLNDLSSIYTDFTQPLSTGFAFNNSAFDSNTDELISESELLKIFLTSNQDKSGQCKCLAKIYRGFF